MYDQSKFIDTAFPTDTPMWTTDNIIIFEHPAFTLRRFNNGEGKPTIVIPPQAGHSSHIADYDVNQSLVETIIATREGPVNVIDWKTCTYARRNETISDLVKQVDIVFNLIGPSHLVGLCQGGWLGTVYTALHQEKVLSLMPIASPIDFHVDGGAIQDILQTVGVAPYRMAVSMANGLMLGDIMLFCWKLMHPYESFIGNYIDIVNNIDKEEVLRKTKRFRTWYEHTLNIAGSWYMEAVEQLFYRNLLIRGKFFIDGMLVDLRKITCPVGMVAGKLDDITLINQLFNLGNYVSSKLIYTKVIPKCGHIGCFMGTKSQTYLSDAVSWTDEAILV